MQLCGRAICPQEGHELGKARSTADASEEGLAPHTCDAHAWLCRAAGHRGLAVRENGCSGPQPGSTQPNTWFLYVLLLRIFNWHYC